MHTPNEICKIMNDISGYPDYQYEDIIYTDVDLEDTIVCVIKESNGGLFYIVRLMKEDGKWNRITIVVHDDFFHNTIKILNRIGFIPER